MKEACPSYIKDTTHLLQKINEVRIPEGEDTVLFTMDVKGLYTNIPKELGLEALRYYLDKREKKYPPTETVIKLAEFVLTRNCMEFDGQFFKQILGTMMGTPFAVEYSCLTMSYVEMKIANDDDNDYCT